MKTLKMYKHYLVQMLIDVVLVLCVLIIPNTTDMLPFMGIILIVASVSMVMVLRDKENLGFLFTILMVCNLAISFSNFLSYRNYAFSWQKSIAGTYDHIILAKSFLIFFLTICCTVMMVIKRKEKYSFSNSIGEGIEKSNIVFYGGFVILLLLLIFGFDRTKSEGYVPASNALYEYAIVIYLFVWEISPIKKKYRNALIVYAILYILQGLLFGDRSSAFPMIILVYILIRKRNISIVNLCGLSILGVFGANLIGIIRNGISEGENIIFSVFNRLFYVDSIAYSFYSGIQIVRARSATGNLIEHLFLWIKTLFAGKSGKADLAMLVAEYSGKYFNRGGGTACAYFYFWGQYFGVVLGGIIIGLFIGKIFKKSNGISGILQILIIVLSLRWYTYFPSVFFRSCLIIPCVLFFIIRCFINIFGMSKKSSMRLNP